MAFSEDPYVRRRFVIGRDPGNDIIITDKTVSSRHCFIHIGTNGEIRLVDMGSSNGVSILRKGTWSRIDQEFVTRNDRVRIGNYETDVASLLLQVQNMPGRRPKDKIFISYRRSDSEQAAGRLFDRLAAEYGADKIFFDTEAIPGAAEFRSRIAAAIQESAVVFALIGKSWLRKPGFLGRIFSPRREDFIEIELTAALEAMVPVVPLLVGDATMPDPKALPKRIAQVSALNAMRLGAGRDFHGDVDKLIVLIEHFRSGTQARKVATPPLPPRIT